MNGRTGTYNRLWLPVIEDEGPELRSLRRETRKGRDLGHGAEGVSDGTGRKQGPNAHQMRTKCNLGCHTLPSPVKFDFQF